MSKRCLTLSVLFFLAACGGPPSVTENTVSSDSASGTVSVNLNKGGVVYTEYSDRLVGRGKSAVLFFFKASDPFSVKSEAVIKKLYGTGAAVVSTYRLDFPTATGARIKYGVLIEDTFVLLDASGQRVASFIHPSPDDVRIILRGNIPVPPKS